MQAAFAPKNIVIVAGINELESSLRAILSHCFSIHSIAEMLTLRSVYNERCEHMALWVHMHDEHH